MATNIFNYDGTLLTSVADGSLDQTHASIKFPGRGYQNYGSPVLENILWVMQNFAGTSAPLNPVTGQLWYDTTDGASILKVWSGETWTTSGGVIASSTSPGNGANQGAFWYDTTNKQLKVWSGTTWDTVGPLGSKINTDPIDPAKPDHSVIEAMRVLGTDAQYHQLWRISVGGSILAIFSKDPVFTPQSAILTANGFNKIYPGLNFNSTISGIGLAGDSTIFKSTQTNLPSLDSSWDLGASSRKFATIHSSNGKFYNGISIGPNASSFQYALDVAGTANFTGQVDLAPNSRTQAPILWSAGQLTTTPQVGAVEFDGNNFYFTGFRNGAPYRQTPIFDAAAVDSNTLYVSNYGNDTNDGRTRSSSYKTLNRALAELKNEDGSYIAGYTIVLESGTYVEQNPMFVPPKTSIVGDNLRRVIVKPVHNQLDLFHVSTNSYFFGMTFKEHRAPAFCFAFPCSLAVPVLGGPGGDEVVSIKPMYSQTGYDALNPPAVFIESPQFGVGRQATAVANIVDGGIVDVIVTNGGSGYSTVPGAVTATVNDPVSGGALAEFNVRVDVNGVVVAVDVVDPGEFYSSDTVMTIGGGGGTGATARVVVGNGVIRNYTMVDQGAGYDPNRLPWISVKPVNQPVITSSPYVQNCSSITGPFDTTGKLITINPPFSLTTPGTGYTAVDQTGAGGGIRIDGEVVDNTPVGGTVIRSFVADSFTQINQGGIGHLILNRGYAQFVSCFTTFSSIGYWARSGGFANISNSVIDFGEIGVQAEGYYPVAYAKGVSAQTYSSRVVSVTMRNTGNGYIDNSTITVTFEPPSIGSDVATGFANVVNGKITSITIVNVGSGYTAVPEITIEDTAGGIGASAFAVLAKNPTILVNPSTGLDTPMSKPLAASAMLDVATNTFYKILGANPGPTDGSWFVDISPSIISVEAGSELRFHDISNISTGGLALEYVGSGVTYNALPYYGGRPDITKQVRDLSTDPLYSPGIVYYVTISNDGNFSIGPFFGVNFIDGSVKLNSSSFQLTNLSSIGPFNRFGEPVGTYADEISLDPSLTHLSDTTLDRTTLPTQVAVRGYFGQVNSNILPSADRTRDLGSTTKRWSSIYGNLNAATASITSATIFESSTTTANSAFSNVSDTAIINTALLTNASIANTVIQSATINAINTSTLQVDNFSANTATITTGLTVQSPSIFVRDVTIAGNLTVNGNNFIANSQSLSVIDPIIEVGSAANGAPLTSNDGKDRGLFFHYYNTTAPIGEVAGDNHAYLGMQNVSRKLLFLTNVSPGTTTIPNPVSLTGTRWGNIEVGGGTFNYGVSINGDTTVTGTLYVTGDIYGFFGSSDSRLKTDVKVINDALTKVSTLDGVTFNWTDEAKNLKKFSDKREAGVIAQQVEEVLPECVKTNDDGFKSVDYTRLIPLLIQAIKELNDKVNRLENKQ